MVTVCRRFLRNRYAAVGSFSEITTSIPSSNLQKTYRDVSLMKTPPRCDRRSFSWSTMLRQEKGAFPEVTTGAAEVYHCPICPFQYANKSCEQQ